MLSLTFSRYLLTGTSPPTPPGIKVKGFFLDEGGRNKDESLYVYPFPATYFNLPYPTLPTQVKVKSEKVKGCRHYIKSKKQVMQHTYLLIGMC